MTRAFDSTCQKDGNGDEEAADGANSRDRRLLEVFVLSESGNDESFMKN